MKPSPHFVQLAKSWEDYQRMKADKRKDRLLLVYGIAATIAGCAALYLILHAVARLPL